MGLTEAAGAEDYAPELVLDGCAYCGGKGQFMPCCPAHQRTGMCPWCRRVPSRPPWHFSPVEGRACCRSKAWKPNPKCPTCAKSLTQRKTEA